MNEGHDHELTKQLSDTYIVLVMHSTMTHAPQSLSDNDLYIMIVFMCQSPKLCVYMYVTMSCIQMNYLLYHYPYTTN